MVGLIVYKLKAFGVHFTVSLIICLMLLGVVYYLWYPEALFYMEQPWRGMWIIVAVDLVLGPLLTLIVINPIKKKKELLLDYGVIVVFQLVGFFGGMWQVYNLKPAALVYWNLGFYVVPLENYRLQGVNVESLSKYANTYVKDSDIPIIQAQYPSELSAIDMMLENNDDGVVPYAQLHLYRTANESIDVTTMTKGRFRGDCGDCYYVRGKYQVGVLNLKTRELKMAEKPKLKP